MRVSIDEQWLFDETVTMEAESNRRESIGRSTAGLDGVMSIDLGGRGRKIRQKGEIRARSKEELNNRFEAISEFMDGKTHTLVADGRQFGNLRIDSLNVTNERTSGAGITADYEIVYLQLMVE